MERPRATWTFRIARAAVRALVSGYFRLEVRGLAHVPARGGAIIAGNHPSVLDGILLMALSPRPVRFLIAEDMYTHRLLHPLFRLFGAIPVYRTRGHNGEALRAAVAALERGEVIGIFPEGTIHQGGRLQQLKRGAALLALKTGVPVVPLAIAGSREAFPVDARMPRPGPIGLRFEAPTQYPLCQVDPIPETVVAETLEQIRLCLLGVHSRTLLLPMRPAAPAWLHGLRVIASGIIVCPLAGLLTATAQPSLDPHRPRAAVSCAQI